jgi:hypothetical protein
MNKVLTLAIAVVCLVVSAFAGENQPVTTDIQPYLLLQQTTIANGKGEFYLQIINQLKDTATATKAETYWLAGSGVTGDSRDLYFVMPMKSFSEMPTIFAEFDKVFEAAKLKNASLPQQVGETELINRSSIWRFSPALSHMPDKVDVAHTTGWMVYTFHLKPGNRTEFSKLVRERKDLITKGNISENWIAYESVAGMDTAMMFVIPLRSFADLDVDQSEAWKAVMTPVMLDHLEATVQKTVNKMESQLIMVRPEFSRPTPKTMAANPDFWTVKQPVVSAEKKGRTPKKAVTNVGE